MAVAVGGGGDPLRAPAGHGAGARLWEPGLLGIPWPDAVGQVRVQGVDIWRLSTTLLREKGRKALRPEL